MATLTKNKVVPKLRFSDFGYNWNRLKINELLAIGSGRDYKHLNDGDIPVYGTGGYMTSVNEYLYDGESVCIGRKGTIDKPRYLNEKFWTVDTLFYTHSFVDCSPKFIYLIFQNINWKKYNEASGVPSLSKKTLEKIKVFIPKINEQQKIASFLTAVDNKLQQLIKKKELLEQYKKGVMQKLFKQELRFKDDNGNDYPKWQKKRLDDVFTSKRGQGLAGKNIVENGNNPCILYGALYTKYNEVIKTVVESTNEESNVKSEVGDILVPASTTTTGIDLANFTALNESNVLLGGDITIMRFKKKGNNIFWSYYLSHYKKFEVAKYAQGSTIVHLYFNHFKNVLIEEPCINEQTLIAEFLIRIDNKIEQVAQQLKETEKFKKGLLQQMFV